MKSSLIRWIGLVITSLFLFTSVSVAQTQTKPRLLNLSTRAETGPGEKTLTAGFVTSPGNSQIRVLLRVVGPGLSQFGITTAVKGVKLELWAVGIMLRDNRSWNDGSTDMNVMRSAISATGAFALPDNGKDCAMVVSLLPGAAYSIQAVSTDGSTGVALIEVYEVP